MTLRKTKPKEGKVALESLSVLGLVLAFETSAGRAWRAPSPGAFAGTKSTDIYCRYMLTPP